MKITTFLDVNYSHVPLKLKTIGEMITVQFVMEILIVKSHKMTIMLVNHVLVLHNVMKLNNKSNKSMPSMDLI
jgi:hypothetical protein